MTHIGSSIRRCMEYKYEELSSIILITKKTVHGRWWTVDGKPMMLAHVCLVLLQLQQEAISELRSKVKGR